MDQTLNPVDRNGPGVLPVFNPGLTVKYPGLLHEDIVDAMPCHRLTDNLWGWDTGDGSCKTTRDAIRNSKLRMTLVTIAHQTFMHLQITEDPRKTDSGVPTLIRYTSPCVR